MSRLLLFGYGFSARALVRRLGDGWQVAATSRSSEGRQEIAAAGVQPLDPAEQGPLRPALSQADALLITAPPGEDGCPALNTLAPLWPHGGGPGWIGYLSTTGVYGDRGGGWVREDSPPAPASPEAARRVEAEAGWARLAEAHETRLALFRLPGIYGPGRSPLDRARAGEAQRWTRPGQVFSRIHVDDLADALVRALERRPTGAFTLCDDEPAPQAEVSAYAHRLLGLEPPTERPLDLDALSPMARRFWSESKRIPNARAKAALAWRPAHPTYREGLDAIWAEERRST